MANSLTQANDLGRGFNIFGAYNSSSFLEPLFITDSSPTHTATILDKECSLPQCVNVIAGTKTAVLLVAGNGRDNFQESLAAKVQITGAAGAFEGELSAAFGSNLNTSLSYSYCEIIATYQLARLVFQPADDLMSPAFKSALDQLPKDLETGGFEKFAAFFDRFGEYYVNGLSLGAECKFLVANSELSTTGDISLEVAAKANFEGVFVTGSIDGSVTASQQWSTYKKKSLFRIQTQGGDLSLGSVIQAVDSNPTHLDPAIPQRYIAWQNSVNIDTSAAFDFSLSGIWNLCGDKRDVVMAAWEEYQSVLFPLLQAANSTQCYPKSVLPSLVLGEPITPPTPPDEGKIGGFQVVVLDLRDILNPASIKLNRFYNIELGDANRGSFPELLDTIASDVSSVKCADGQHALIILSYGLYRIASPPTTSFRNLLLSAGAGDGLTQWSRSTTNGLTVSYFLCGTLGSSNGAAIDKFELGSGDVDSLITIRSTVQFLKSRTDGSYIFRLKSYNASVK